MDHIIQWLVILGILYCGLIVCVGNAEDPAYVPFGWIWLTVILIVQCVAVRRIVERPV